MQCTAQASIARPIAAHQRQLQVSDSNLSKEPQTDSTTTVHPPPPKNNNHGPNSNLLQIHLQIRPSHTVPSHHRRHPPRHTHLPQHPRTNLRLHALPAPHSHSPLSPLLLRILQQQQRRRHCIHPLLIQRKLAQVLSPRCDLRRMRRRRKRQRISLFTSQCRWMGGCSGGGSRFHCQQFYYRCWQYWRWWKKESEDDDDVS